MLNNLKPSDFSSLIARATSGRCGRWFTLAGVVVGLAACSSSPTPNYYTLTPKVKPLLSSNVRVIEVMPVGLPERLNRSSLVLQDGNGKTKVMDNDRWTATLGAELRDGLSAGLQQKLGAVDRYNSGMTGGKVSYRIAADFSRFDIVENVTQKSMMSNDDLDIEVVVAWMIKRDDPNRALSTETSTKGIAAKQQLSCRMAFSQKVVLKEKKIPDIVSTSRDSLNRVVDAIAASFNAAESNTRVSIDAAVCS